MSTLSTLGFLNYYGMQRFGTAPIPTHVIGLALLRSDWALAVHLILRPREGEGDDVTWARQVWEAGRVEEAAKIMPRRAVAEKASEFFVSSLSFWRGLMSRVVLDWYAHNNQTDHLSALSRVGSSLHSLSPASFAKPTRNRFLKT